jgi:hypothetical protein
MEKNVKPQLLLALLESTGYTTYQTIMSDLMFSHHRPDDGGSNHL